MKKKVIRCITFFLLGVFLFAQLQVIVTPKRTDDFFGLAWISYLETDTLDVVFVGGSHVYNGVSPMEIYKETGLTAYDLGSPAQTISVTYYYLKDLFRTQSPTVVFLDASSLFRHSETESYELGWKYVFDFQPFGYQEYQLFDAYSQETEISADKKYSIIFPIYEYHTRWDELTKVDFQKKPKKVPYTMGYYMLSTIIGTSTTADTVNSEVNALKAINTAPIKEKKDGIHSSFISDEQVYEANIISSNIDWLLKIQELCIEEGALLILTKIPVMKAPQDYDSAWTDEKRNQVKSLSDTYNIPFLDLGYGEPVSIDFTQDTVDAGRHLNIRGAEKISKLFSDFLYPSFPIENEPQKQYDSALLIYQKVKEIAMLQSEVNFITYLDRLIEHSEQWDIFISAGGEYANGLTVETKKKLQELGCTLVSEGSLFDCYLAAIIDGKTEYEALSARELEYQTSRNEDKIEMISSSWRTGSLASIQINDTECAVWGRGLNFVVIDKETNQVIDSVAFDTHTAAMSASRNWGQTSIWLDQYADSIEPQISEQEDKK